MAPRTRIAGLATVAAALALAGSALAAGWSGFASLPTSGGTITSVKLASDPAGNEVAIWVEQPSPFKVMASFRPLGGAWGTPQTLDASATTQPVTDVAADPSGNFVVLYSEVVAATKKVFSAYLPAGQTAFGAPQQFGTTLSGATTLTGLAVALSPAGTAYAVFGIAGAVGVGGFRPAGAGSAWTLASTGLPTDSGTSIDLAVTADGTPTLADYAGASGPLRHTRFNGKAWTTITTPAGSGNASGTVVIAPDAGDRTTTLYQVASTFTQLGTQSCPPGTTAPTQCTARTTLQLTPLTSVGSPALAVSPTGDAAASWTEGQNVAVARRAGATGAWSAATQIGSGTGPAAIFDSNAGLTTLYAEGGTAVKFLYTPSGGALTPPSIALTDPAQSWSSPIVAADASGDVYGAWVSGGTSIQTAVYDDQAPTMPALRAPAAAVAGSPIAFSASASDVWSGVTYTWDYGDGATDSGANTTHAYSASGDYVARATARDAAGNQASQTTAVHVTAVQQQAAGLPRPVAGQTVNLELVSGTVLVRVPGSTRFVKLFAPAQVRNGAIIDARKGRVRITIDNGLGGLDTADFYGGEFRFTQPKVRAGRRWFADLYLYGGSFKGCPRAPSHPRIARAPQKHGSVRQLWASGKGSFRTAGRFASATIRGTTWLTDDRCDGTLTKVTAGKVGVRDFVLNKTVLVTKGKRYFAHP